MPSPLPPAARAVAAWCGVVLLTAAVVVGAVALFVWLRAAVVPAVLALLVAALLEPVYRWLRRRGLATAWSAGLTCAALVVAVGGALWLLVTLLTDASGQISDALETAADRVTDEGPVGTSVHGAVDGLIDLGKSLASAAAKGVLSGLGLAAQLLAGAVLTLALVFFLLRDRDRAVAALRGLAPPGQEELMERMARRAYLGLAGFMRGTAVVALIDGTFIAAGLALLGVPHALGLGVLVFFGAYVPYVGAILTGTVAVLVAFADGGLAKALGALGVVFAVQMLEGTVLQPVVQSRTVAMHPAVVMLAITAGASVGGLLGTLLAVPLAATAFGVIEELRDRGSEHTAGA